MHSEEGEREGRRERVGERGREGGRKGGREGGKEGGGERKGGEGYCIFCTLVINCLSALVSMQYTSSMTRT